MNKQCFQKQGIAFTSNHLIKISSQSCNSWSRKTSSTPKAKLSSPFRKQRQMCIHIAAIVHQIWLYCIFNTRTNTRKRTSVIFISIIIGIFLMSYRPYNETKQRIGAISYSLIFCSRINITCRFANQDSVVFLQAVQCDTQVGIPVIIYRFCCTLREIPDFYIRMFSDSILNIGHQLVFVYLGSVCIDNTTLYFTRSTFRQIFIFKKITIVDDTCNSCSMTSVYFFIFQISDIIFILNHPRTQVIIIANTRIQQAYHRICCAFQWCHHFDAGVVFVWGSFKFYCRHFSNRQDTIHGCNSLKCFL